MFNVSDSSCFPVNIFKNKVVPFFVLLFHYYTTIIKDDFKINICVQILLYKGKWLMYAIF